ncbi:MAG: class I SAM-dependent methyltransferase [Deltaproteobacteria bacterium]|jgi:SAM-dependent methyltransferase|nr:class I SAM-dependent methyltransferase [Deltaproteobacteria bacterium]
MEKTPDELVDFWNRRASTFPRYNETAGCYADRVLAAVEAHGLSFAGKTVLDVGAGSGQFTLKIAKKAKRVVALDVSDQMLAISQADAINLGLANVEYVVKPINEYRPAQRFDLTFASMCPALRDDDSRRWLLESAQEAAIYLGFIDYVAPGPMPRLMERYQVERKLFNSGPDMEKWLKDNGHGFAGYPLEGTWTIIYDRQEALHWCHTMLNDYGVGDPDPAFLDQCLADFWDPAARDGAGAYVFDTPYFVDLIVWERKNP